MGIIPLLVHYSLTARELVPLENLITSTLQGMPFLWLSTVQRIIRVVYSVLVLTMWTSRIEHDDQVRCVQCIKHCQEKEVVELSSRDGAVKSLIILLEVIKRSSAVRIHRLEIGWRVRQSQVSLLILGLWIVVSLLKVDF